MAVFKVFIASTQPAGQPRGAGFQPAMPASSPAFFLARALDVLLAKKNAGEDAGMAGRGPLTAPVRPSQLLHTLTGASFEKSNSPAPSLPSTTTVSPSAKSPLMSFRASGS